MLTKTGRNHGKIEEEEEEETNQKQPGDDPSTYKKIQKYFSPLKDVIMELNENNAQFFDHPSTTTSRKMNFSESKYIFYQNKRLYVSDILRDYKEAYAHNQYEFIKQVTVDQVVRAASKEDMIRLDDIQKVEQYIRLKSHNYNRLEKAEVLGKGWESQILRLNVFQPVEIVAKTPLPSSNGEAVQYMGIMMESHLLKMLADPEYIAKIHEEIIDYDPIAQSVLNYVVIVERAKYDLDKIVSIWGDQEKSKENQEEFSQEKLAYFCLKAMEAVYYCHSHDVYYGDMKPQNLLVFRDLSVKLGDFGISIKLKPNPIKSEYLKQTAQLKGLTRGYTLQTIEESFNFDQETQFTYHQLISNDYYSLRVTFENILRKFKDKIKTDSLFYQMVKDLKELITKNKDLQQVLYKWRSIISNDKSFIEKLCDQIIKEEKIIAILSILKLSKYRKMFIEIQKKFEDQESKTFQYKKDCQFSTLIQEQVEDIVNAETLDPFFPIYFQSTLSQQSFIEEMIDDIEPYLKRLFIFTGPLDPSYYKEYYYEVFNLCFNHKSELFPTGKSLSRETFNECPQYLLLKEFKSENEEVQKEKQVAFQRFVDFIVSTSARTDSEYERMLLAMIKFSVEIKLPELEFELIYCYNKTNFDEKNERIMKNKYDFAFRSKQMSKAKGEFDKAIQCYIFAINYKKDFQQGIIWNHEIKYDMKRITSLPKGDFELYKFKSYYSQYYALKATAVDYEQEKEVNSIKKIEILEKERKLYSKIYGEQGRQMLQNGISLYQVYRSIGDTQKKAYYQMRILDYSESRSKIEILSFLIQDNEDYIMNYHENLKTQVHVEVLPHRVTDLYTHLKSSNIILFYLCYKYYHKIQPEDNLFWNSIEYEQIVELLLNRHGFNQILPFLKAKDLIYSKYFQELVGKESLTSTNVEEQYQSWSDKFYEELLTSAIPKRASKINETTQKEKDKINNFLLKNAHSFDKSILSSEFVIERIGRYFGETENGKKLDGTGLLIFNDGTSYFGEFKDNNLDGYGQYFFLPDQKKLKYVGEFKKNVACGLGVLHYSNNSTYTGSFRNEQFSGKGKLVKKSSLYEGDWLEGKKHGYGTKTKTIGEKTQVQCGWWHENMMDGEGTFQILVKGKEIERYEGNWKKGMRNGQGIQKYQNLAIYEGQWKDNKRHGEGVLALPNNEDQNENEIKYTGVWNAGEFEGDGETSDWVIEFNGSFHEVAKVVKELPNGDIFTGFLKGQNFFGYGVLTSKNGEIYRGEFLDNKKYGEGELILSNGDIFRGNFKNNAIWGTGLYTLRTGYIEKVDFIDNQQLTYKGDEEYEGTILDDLKHGYGVYKSKEKGLFYEGFFVNDQFEGQGKLIDTNGDEYEGESSKGKKNGKGYLKFKSGGFYDGEFQQNYYQGNGILSLPDKTNEQKVIESKGSQQLGSAIMGSKIMENRDVERENGQQLMVTYEGSFRKHKKDGFGIILCKDFEYKGIFSKDMKSGLGQEMGNSSQATNLYSGPQNFSNTT